MSLGEFFAIWVLVAVFVISAVSTYYSLRLYLALPRGSRDPVRHLLAAVVTLSVTSSAAALTIVSWDMDLGLSHPAETVAKVALLASMSFFFLMSFQVKEGKLGSVKGSSRSR